ncbi:MAG: HlyD family efflux transporter periplasmic adaptor subunit, partial [Proteobacteria bacterium]|nr:HlyD family efflux transporter periplasmic adaptor subunit [Pseudomonadota bacterium]
IDILKRSVIKAPVSGFVMDLKKHTIGGIIAPAEEIMYVVPNNAQLIAEVKIRPQDVDLLKTGLTAKVQLSAFKTRLMPKLNGKVLSFSADSFKNEATGEIYFKARIEIPKLELLRLKEDIKLTPGMPVEVFIVTGSRTMGLDLITPIKESTYKAFRES